MTILDYYKIIKNSVQFKEADLVAIRCYKNDVDVEGRASVNLRFERETNLLAEDIAEVKLITYLSLDNDFFNFEIEYKGICYKLDETISEEMFERYAHDQVVPLLLPYVRECISSLMSKMNIPVFTIPTIDVLDTLEANSVERVNSYNE